jgi:peptidyl-prolyl cis-trans isomerase C
MTRSVAGSRNLKSNHGPARGRRLVRSLCAGTLAAFLLLSVGCNKPQPKGQVIVVVNGEEITIGELNEEARARGLSIGNDPRARASAVRDLVSRKLLVQEARRRKIDRTPEHLLASRRLDELLLVREFVGGTANPAPLTDAEVMAYVRAHPFAFDKRVLIRVSQIAAPASFRASLGAAGSLDDVQALLQKAKVPARRTEEVWDSAQLPENLTARLLTSNGGLILLPGQGTTLAVQVTALTPQPVPADQQVARTRQWLEEQRSDAVLQKLIDNASVNASIDYQRGFEPR